MFWTAADYDMFTVNLLGESVTIDGVRFSRGYTGVLGRWATELLSVEVTQVLALQALDSHSSVISLGVGMVQSSNFTLQLAREARNLLMASPTA